jgi:UDP-N-acetylmuramoyl-tripeptide--D-alanyl-D-alanine ligase
MMTLRELALMIPHAETSGPAETWIGSVTIDSRSVQRSALFVAIPGERFDGHDFVGDATDRGASALLVARRVESHLPQLVVGDTREALGLLAHGWRSRFDLPLIVVTGSNGKTTTKEMIASILASAHGVEGRLATRGNLNNDIGLPLTLLQLRSVHRAAVIELGMNHPGETAWLARIAAPTVAVITNAQREHQEFMKSVEAVAREHALALNALPESGVGVFPADSGYADLWRETLGARRVMDFTVSKDALDPEPAVAAVAYPDQEASVVHFNTPAGTVTALVRASGSHNVSNAAAAAAACVAIGIEGNAIRDGLEAFRPVTGRMQLKAAANGARIYDDTYNANPDSVRAAIEVLSRRSAPRLLVLGDMGEVGESGPLFHAEVASAAALAGIERFMAVGPLMRHAVDAFGANASHFERVGDLTEAARAWIDSSGSDSSTLIKGSRFMAMEQVVSQLVASGNGDAQSQESH